MGWGTGADHSGTLLFVRKLVVLRGSDLQRNKMTDPSRLFGDKKMRGRAAGAEGKERGRLWERDVLMRTPYERDEDRFAVRELGVAWRGTAWRVARCSDVAWWELERCPSPSPSGPLLSPAS